MLAGFCVLFITSIEIVFSHPVKHYSVTYQRVSQQYAEALRARPSQAGEPISVLMVGNSLLLDGVDVPRLQALTSGRLRIYPIFLEFTTYYDWLYALRRLFRQGARPQIVVVGLGPDSVIEDTVRAEYSPILLFDAGDVLHVSSDLGLDRTATMNLLLAHWSTFWDMRAAVRAQILRRIVPDAEDLFEVVKRKRPVTPAPDAEPMAISRLRILRRLVEGYGARLILLIPPPTSDTGVRQTVRAASKVGVDTLVPIDPVTLPPSLFQPDAIHLNSQGATRFTSALGENLPTRIMTREIATRPQD
jgi:hypothetical protein